MELLELPKEMPIAVRWLAAASATSASGALICAMMWPTVRLEWRYLETEAPCYWMTCSVEAQCRDSFGGSDP